MVNGFAKIYVVFYTDQPDNKRNLRIVKIFTDANDVKKYLLTKVTFSGKRINKDRRWVLQVFEHIASNDSYEYSKWETAAVKESVGVCAHCLEYFERENNSNFCADCLRMVRKGFKVCDVCHEFFDLRGESFTSNGDVFPSLVCEKCCSKLVKLLANS